MRPAGGQGRWRAHEYEPAAQSVQRTLLTRALEVTCDEQCLETWRLQRRPALTTQGQINQIWRQAMPS